MGKIIKNIICAGLILSLLSILTGGQNLYAQTSKDDQRPTVQKRFAPKEKLLYGQALVMTHVRDDFYDTFGFGVDIGYFVKENIGFELRALKTNTTLDDAAVDLKERIGITPDAWAQDYWFKLGIRYAPGYGKLLMWKSFLLHFDPQFVAHAGIALAEARILPSFQVAFSTLFHFKWGLKAKLDLGISIQGEKRDRGWIWTTGFAPVLGFGWGHNF